MKDERFVDEANWISANERGRARGEALLRELGDPAQLVVGVRAVLAGDQRGSGANHLPGALVEEVTRFVDGLDLHLTDGAWFAIAKGLASLAVGGTPSPRRLMEAASRLGRTPQWVHHAFHEECLALLEKLDAPTLEAWLSLLGAPPSVPTAQRRVPSAPVDVVRREARWQVVDPFELWDESGAAIQLVAVYEPLNLLRRLDEQRWFRAVDAWDDGRLVFAALFGSHTRHDRDALLRHLSASALVFYDSGKWTGRTAAVVLTQSIIEHGAALASAVRGAPNLSDAERDAAVARLANDELPAYFTGAWRTLLARTDGLALAVALHVRLAEPQPVLGVYHVDVPAIALRSLSQCLIEMRPSAANLRTLWRLRRDAHDGAGRSRAVSGLRAFACATTIAKGDERLDPELFEWLSELLRGDPSEWRFFATGGSLPALLERVAELLAKNDDALPKLEDLFASLEPSRRRGEFGRTHAENDSDIASILLLVLLVRVLDRSHAAGSADEPIEVSARIFRRALRLYLVSSPSSEPTLSARAALTLAIQLRVRVDQAALAECLTPVLTDPGHAAEVAAVLLTTTRRAELEEAIAATYGNLDELQSRAQEWALATNLPRDSKAANALASALSPRTKLDEPVELGNDFGVHPEPKK